MAISKQVPAAVPQPKRVYRFNLAERIAHWNHVLSFLILLFTGSALVFRGFSSLLGRDGMLLFGQVHRVIAVLFTVVTVPVLMIGARKLAGAWVRDSFRFDRDDKNFLVKFAREFFGLHVDLPPQGRFNAGEKINSIFQIIGWVVMVVTGWMLVFKEQLPHGVAQWTLSIHSFTAFFLGAVVIGHIYLAVGHPNARPGFSGMKSGWVPAWWAKEHYRKWYDEETTAKE